MWIEHLKDNVFRTKSWLFVLAVLLGIGSLNALSAEPVSSAQQPQKSTQSPESVKQSSDPKPSSVDAEFEPTEEISEDISVPFPVDI